MSNLDSFKVYARCRPLNEREKSYNDHAKTVNIIDECTLALTDYDSKESVFQVNGVFSQDSTNPQIFN
jgi:hypothetical protein